MKAESNPKMSLKEWMRLDDKGKSEYVSSWSKNNNQRKPRLVTNKSNKSRKNLHQEENVTESMMAEWVMLVKNYGSARLLEPQFDSLKSLDWWHSLCLPKKKLQHVTKCDVCNHTFYNETRCNKRRNGFPVYIVCQYCYDWSLPTSYKKMGGIIKGSAAPPSKSGKSFTKSWTSKYKTMKKFSDKGRNGLDNSNYISKTSNVVKEAVLVVETGVAGLIHGASEALKDISLFPK